MGSYQYASRGVPYSGLENDGTDKYWSGGIPYQFIRLSIQSIQITKDLTYTIPTITLVVVQDETHIDLTWSE